MTYWYTGEEDPIKRKKWRKEGREKIIPSHF